LVSASFTNQDILAKTYGFQNYENLLSGFGGADNVLKDIENFDIAEKSGLLRKFGLSYVNDNQFFQVVKNVMNK
jgi:hypothetical protein